MNVDMNVEMNVDVDEDDLKFYFEFSSSQVK